MEAIPHSTLPDGVVTFLFSDIEGSTRLIERFGVPFNAYLETHNAVLRREIEGHDGTVVSTEGDSFFAVFANPLQSLNAAVGIQRQLAACDWPKDGAIRVRIGIHTGFGVHGGDDYLGIDVNRAARISAAGSGGQILVSDATASLAGGRLPDSTELVDLGKHRLKDLSEPEALYQLTVLGLAQEFPRLRTLEAIPNNLPLQLTTFIGRQGLVAEISDLLRRERLVTLTGPGGTGKTRLSLQVAAEISDDFPDGVFFVPLAPVSDPSIVASEILDVLGLQPTNASPDDQLASELREKCLLLILDNFEQILGAASLIAALARAAHQIKFLTTSRAPLSISGEQELQIPPLATPTLDADLATEEFESVRLFVDRARLVDHQFELNSENAPYVASLVENVDGLPLAIELLASRVKLLPPKELLHRYEARTLASPKRDLPERQLSMWGAIDWSYDLLGPSERRLFRELAVFNGGGRLEEIELTCTRDEGDLIGDLSVLVDHSLVRRRNDSTGPRFTMLHVIKEYALEKLRESGEAEVIAASHARVYLNLAEQAAADILGPDRKSWLSRLDFEHDNLRAALANRYQAGDADSAMRFISATWRFMQARGHLHEAKMRIDEVLAISDQPTLSRAKALEAAGGVAWWRGDLDQSAVYYTKALEICEQLDEPRELANALYNYGLAGGFSQSLNPIESTSAMDKAQHLYESLDDNGGLGDVHWGKANLEMHRGKARMPVVQSLLETAATFYERAGNDFGLGWSNFELGENARRSGDFETAERRLRAGLRVFNDQGDLSGVVLFLALLSSVALASGDIERAHRLSGTVTTLRLSTGTDLVVAEPNVVEGLEYERLEALTGDAGLPYREGRAMSVAQAVAYALEDAGISELPDR